MIMSVNYISSALAWSIIGFLIGVSWAERVTVGVKKVFRNDRKPKGRK